MKTKAGTCLLVTREEFCNRIFIYDKSKNRLIVSKNDELKALNYTKDKLFSVIGYAPGNHYNKIFGFLEVLVSYFK